MFRIAVCVVLLVGCGSVAQQSAPDASGAAGTAAVGAAGASGSVAGTSGGSAGTVAATGAGAAGTQAQVDAGIEAAQVVEAGTEAAMEAKPEVAAPDVITGMWSFNFTPNRGHGDMVLALNGALVTGSYSARGIPPNDQPGAGSVTGSYDGTTLTLTFSGAIVAKATGPVETDGTGTTGVPDGKGHATIGADTVGFMASAH